MRPVIARCRRRLRDQSSLPLTLLGWWESLSDAVTCRSKQQPRERVLLPSLARPATLTFLFWVHLPTCCWIRFLPFPSALINRYRGVYKNGERWLARVAEVNVPRPPSVITNPRAPPPPEEALSSTSGNTNAATTTYYAGAAAAAAAAADGAAVRMVCGYNSTAAAPAGAAPRGSAPASSATTGESGFAAGGDDSGGGNNTEDDWIPLMQPLQHNTQGHH